MKNQVLNILIPNEATGFKIISLSGWIGKCFLIPRAELREIKDKPEVGSPAIYFLFGEDDESTNQKLYIGESEVFVDRLLSHSSNKDFWNTAIVFTGGLDKAKIKYLEYLSLKDAYSAARYDLDNSNSPEKNSLSEFDKISTEDYLVKIKYVLSALGYPVFDEVHKVTSNTTFYYLKGEGYNAKGQLLEDGSLNVFKDSLVRVKETDSFTGWALASRKRFLEEGSLVATGDTLSYALTKDILFKSPSAAASTITGRSINGWTAWKDENGNSLDENLRK